MLNGLTLTAVVPARGGSKGLPGKNLLPLAGEPLVVRAARLATACDAIDRVVVTSDDPTILDAAGTVAGVVALERPAALASDTAKTADVVLDLLQRKQIEPGYILLLQPTSPLRALSDLAALLSAFTEGDWDAAVSLIAHDEPRPEKLQRIEGGGVRPYLREGFEGPRQDLPQPYALNGAFYLIDSDILAAQRSFLPERTMAFLMPAERSINIDSRQDWDVLNAMVAAGHWSLDDGA